jgi:hypothetical protein
MLEGTEDLDIGSEYRTHNLPSQCILTKLVTSEDPHSARDNDFCGQLPPKRRISD